MKIWHFTFDLFSMDVWGDEFLLNFFEVTINNKLFILFQIMWDERPEVLSFIKICNIPIYWW